MLSHADRVTMRSGYRMIWCPGDSVTLRSGFTVMGTPSDRVMPWRCDRIAQSLAHPVIERRCGAVIPTQGGSVIT
jgi:hypothetical protein